MKSGSIVVTWMELRASTYFDACTVKGHFLERFESYCELNVILFGDGDEHLVRVIARDGKDRTGDFRKEHDYLLGYGKCLPSIEFCHSGADDV
ncbi:hypothetical protein [Chamaesiphon minutus]|uniref:Uncharacterized protein n=1 Tax=Chamaesiphon minutus (strain ATCC 27169 / PCC 6605) TaxID=1173020 RepID=K9UDA6_CHAP6|nr:hypothetical protein [Chamaesiphon minutus]AFY92790.1 hypothetical protein Cha6605_1646 [Chamaesiphon minutus PCC 6605]